MTMKTKTLSALQRGALWVRATLDPHDIDPYERAPIYHGAQLGRGVPDRFRDAGPGAPRAATTARNHMRYPLD